MPNTILILESDRYNPDALELYSTLGRVEAYNNSNARLLNDHSVFAIVCRLAHYLDPIFLKKFENLKFIISPTTGLNHIDNAYCKSHGIRIVSLKGETKYLNSIKSTSEHTMALIFALVRNIVPSVRSVVDRHQWNRDLYIGRELSSLTIGILGVGRIGKHIISYARSFGMKILICDSHQDLGAFKDAKVTVCSKKQLFEKSDIVTIHVDYRPDNHHMITQKEFGWMKTGSYFINTSRGELVSEDALIWALERGILTGAALDVLSEEQSDKAFFNKRIIQYAQKNDNIIITPHLGGCTIDAMHNTELFMAKKFANIINN
ncbi:D-isomer specific 2-hydroxyacid dehydrogenase family protein [uncultured Desulfobacter sp.]|uniref:D-isomer specific 2-hydroxyacid dehydrogenase family protein n=1 Tax=uncultured Desulfobacter sp. TaxID=240139 RepID=UPI0029F5ABC5|nr:D-isomer specific 2-hydroxyacid dehydrogenase family protein [uncultured Desulfobacter sp.]